jgi:anti-sigma factor RsiW
MAGCEEVRDHLAAYCDGTGEAAECAGVERHLSGCPVCAAEVGELRQMLARLAALPTPEPTAEFWEGFAATLECRLAAEPPPTASVWVRLRIWLADLTWLRPLQALGAAAALGILLTIGLVRTPRLPGERPVADPVAIGESLRIGQHLEVLERLELLEELELLEVLPLPASENGGKPGVI